MSDGTVYLAVAQWGFPPELGTLPTHHVAQEFATLVGAQAFCVAQGGHDDDALLKVYAGKYDADHNFIETKDWYYDGRDWLD